MPDKKSNRRRYLNNQGVFTLQVLDNGWVRSLVKRVAGITEVGVTVTTDDQVNTMGLGSEFHIWTVSIMRDGKDTFDAFGLQLINIFLNSRDWICERDSRASVGDIASGLMEPICKGVLRS